MGDIEPALLLQLSCYCEGFPLPPPVDEEVGRRPESFNEGVSDKWNVVEPYSFPQLLMGVKFCFNVTTMVFTRYDREVVVFRYRFYPAPSDALLRPLCRIAGVGANKHSEPATERRTRMGTSSFVEMDFAADQRCWK